jgi:hypothetical protein
MFGRRDLAFVQNKNQHKPHNHFNYWKYSIIAERIKLQSLEILLFSNINYSVI